MTWEQREQPILETVRDVEETESRYVDDYSEVEELTGLSAPEVTIAMQALMDGKYLTGDVDDSSLADTGTLRRDIRLLPRGRRATEQWPPEEAVAALVRAVEHERANTDDEQQRQALSRFLSFLRDASASALGPAVLQGAHYLA